MNIKPYGDTSNDGAMQLSFTLPVPYSGKAKEAARLYILKLGFAHADIVHARAISENFTFFVAYARSEIAIDYDKVDYSEAVDKVLSMQQTDEFISQNFGRKLNIIGACTGSDAHTVGIDAIMNMKGYNHHFGLERYAMLNALNMGSQVSNEHLLEKAIEMKADALLVSQIVTQKDVHIKNLTNLIELAEAEGIREKMLMIIGGPRIDNKLAKELGFDAGFGSGSYADHVATFIVHKLLERKTLS